MKTPSMITMFFMATQLWQQISSLGAGKACAVTVNGQSIAPTNLPFIEGVNKVDKISYIEGSRTWDTMRYASTKKFPLTTCFTDRYNNEWSVSIIDANSQVSLCIPCTGEINWHGDEKDRTAFDAQTEWAQLQLSYTPASCLQSHGICVQGNAYSLDNIGENKINSQRWAEVLDMVSKGIPIASAFADLVGSLPVPEGLSEDNANGNNSDNDANKIAIAVGVFVVVAVAVAAAIYYFS